MVAQEQIEISIIGTVTVRVAGHPVPIPRGRPRILLAALALEPGRPRAVNRLTDYLWGEALPENPRASLQNIVRRLRQLIGAETIRTFPQGYQLDLPADRIDVHRFFRLADELAGCPAEQPERRGALIESMQRLWRDEPLAEVGSSTLVREYAPALFERYLAMVEARADADIAAGHQARAIGDLRELTARLPLQESLWARLLRMLRDTGRVAEALDAYEQLRTTLADELGADPGPALRELHHELLTANVPAPSTISPPPDAASAGTRSPKEPDRSRETPPPAAEYVGPEPEPEPAPEPPRQLPSEPAGFVGRATEESALDATLESGSDGSDERAAAPIRLAVLHGPGGIGKTSLATRWAHRVAPHFPDGQLYIDLQGFGPNAPLEPHPVLGMFLRSLSVPPEQVPIRTAERSALFRSRVAGQRILLVLDNARDEEQVRPLLPGSGAMVLVTSRNRLRDLSIREGATSLALPEFPAKDARVLIERVLGADRLTETGHGLGDLIDLCGGLPLALRIAAEMCTRYPDTPVPDLVTELAQPSDPPGRLIDGLRAIHSWTYRALPARAARLFRYLGRFPGRTIGAQAAAALLDDTLANTTTLLDTLVTVHLVEESRPGRYGLHDLTRAYASERFRTEIPEAEQLAASRRILDWYVHATAAADYALGYTSKPFTPSDRIGAPARPLPRFDERATAMRWLETELPAVLEIAEDAAEHEHDEHGWQFGRALQYFLIGTCRADERLRLTELGLAAAERIGHPDAIQQAASSLGGALKDVGRRQEAETALLLSLRHAGDRGDHLHMAAVLSVLGAVADEAGDQKRATEYHDQAIEIAQRSSDGAALAAALVNSGSNAIGYGDLDKAIQQSTEALRWYIETDKPALQAVVLGNLADAHMNKGDLETARRHAEQALAILEDLGDRRHATSFLIDLGHIHARSGRSEQAAESWHRALAMTQPSDWRVQEIRSALASLTEQRPPG